MSHPPTTLPQALLRAAERHGDRPAVVDGDRTRSWSELRVAVRRTAAAYVRLGLAPGDRVTIWAPNSLEWVVAALAVSHAGGTLVPVNTRYKGHEVVDLLRRTGATLAVVADGFLGRSQIDEVTRAAGDSGLPDLRTVVRIGPGESDTEVRAFDELAVLADDDSLAEADRRASAVAADDVADILFTSGTTGRSKGVVSAHRQTVSAARLWGETCGVTEQDRYLVVNPFFHSFGYKAGIVVALLTGCCLYPQATFDVDQTLRLIDEEGITVLPGAPTIFTSLFASPGLASTDRSSLRIAVTGAAVVPVALVERMQAELGFDHVLTAFGMTECVVATMCRPGDPDDVVASTCGAPVSGVEVRIVDPETGTELPAGGEGEVQFRGDLVMVGYLDDEEATAQAIDADGWLHTGDVGRVDEQDHLTITDRLKDMYISGGFNVYPAEVEQALARLGGVVESAVVGMPDERMGEVGRAFVVRTSEDALSVGDVADFLRQRVANFKMPRDVVFIDQLPRNAAGKVLKDELRSKP
ncbi:MAG: FadD3 family acyl-CoA ligase [Nocardioides sp.]|uniref:FadD3 family acyl-CoA ligase n=1 Tax=Nocardioides sp. TaxID=35761 RepID=UPI003262E0EA